MKLYGIFIGDFDRKVTIEQATEVIDSVSGQRKAGTWSMVVTMWTNRMQESKEGFEVAKQVANNTGQWVMRFSSLITEKMRVNDHGVFHYIKEIKVVDRNNYMVLTTEERDG